MLRIYRNLRRIRNIFHLIRPFGAPSPQGEGFGLSKPVNLRNKSECIRVTMVRTRSRHKTVPYARQGTEMCVNLRTSPSRIFGVIKNSNGAMKLSSCDQQSTYENNGECRGGQQACFEVAACGFSKLSDHGGADHCA